MRIYFTKGGIKTEINGNYVISLAQSGSLFDSQFKLGSTLTKCLTFEIDTRAFPNGFDYDGVILEGSKTGALETSDGEVLATSDNFILGIKISSTIEMRIDSCTIENNKRYKITCYDEMMYLNQDLDYNYASKSTVGTILSDILTNHNLTYYGDITSLYGYDMVVSWSLDCSEREFVSYLAEINGAYAYVDSGEFHITPFDSTPKQTIKAENTSGYEIGAKHIIDRFYLEMATKTYYYPDTTSNETCYLNSDNLLITDLEDESYTIENTVQHIANIVSGLTFYNLKIDRCELEQTIKAGDFIELVVDNVSYPTIVELDTTFNTVWRGGYELELGTAEQVEENQVINSTKTQLKNLKITVDRDLNRISQQVSDTISDVNTLKETTSTLTQTSTDLVAKVSSVEKSISDEDEKITKKTKYFIAYDDGLAVSENAKVVGEKTLPTGNHVLITESSFEVKKDDTIVASMSENTFQTSNWTMRQYDNNNIFNIFKGGK